MLNKETILYANQYSNSHVIVTVEYDKGWNAADCGWNNNRFGSISKIPTWDGSKPTYLYSSYGYSAPRDDHFGIDKTIIVTRLDTMDSFTFSGGLHITYGGQGKPIFNQNDDEKQIPLTFDPPPDGYLDPNTMQPI